MAPQRSPEPESSSEDPNAPTLLRTLIKEKNSQKFSTFEAQFRRAGAELAEQYNEPDLRKVTVSPRQFDRWYGGKVKTEPYPDACRILEYMFGHPIRELLAPAKPGTPEAASTLRSPHAFLTHPPSSLGGISSSAGIPIISGLNSVFLEYVKADRLMGSSYLLDSILAQIPVIERICDATRGSDRIEVLRFSTVFLEFCGWLHQDSGDLICAAHWTNQSLDYALEVGDPRTIAYTLMRKASIATESGHPGHGLGIANTALANADALTPRLRAVILRERAHAYALLKGSRESTTDSENAITEAMAGIDQEEEDRAPYCTPTFIEMEAGASWELLGDPAAALPVLRAARSEWSDPGQVRDYAICLSRLAIAYAADNEPEQACAIAEEAITLASGLGSHRVTVQLAKLHGRLNKWAQDPIVADLRMRLETLAI